MDRIITEHVGIVGDRAEVVDEHGLDIGAAGLDEGAQNQAANAAKPVDCNFHSHFACSV